jgi:hypothetical protein
MISLTSFAQVKSGDFFPNKTAQNIQNSEAVIFRLYPTQNMWTFIKLNTRNGQIWQVQYDVKENNRMVSSLSLELLVSKDQETNGRFILCPTQNVYTFLLLDQFDGRVWQAQWSPQAEQRGIVPIPE